MAFHLIHINEVYTNADGSIQFIELLVNDGANNENFLLGQSISATQSTTTHIYNFDSDLGTPTGGKSILVATPGFASLGVVTPDYVLPSNSFLFTSGSQTITYSGSGHSIMVMLPTNGSDSLNDEASVTGLNSPTNFFGATATVFAGSSTANTFSGTSGIDGMAGLGGADKLSGSGGNDRIFGGDGNDALNGGAGNDFVNGGSGNDTASYAGAAGGVTVKLALAAGQNTVGAGTDTLVSIENLTGSAFADKLFGNGAANKLNGGDRGDQLRGGAGNDQLTGGAGADRFVFDSALNVTTNKDNILDLQVGTDKIWLDEDIFTALAPGDATRNLGPEAFHLGTVAGDSSDRILYDQSTGKLYYDADGDGTDAAPVQFAELTGKPVISNTSFQIIE